MGTVTVLFSSLGRHTVKESYSLIRRRLLDSTGWIEFNFKDGTKHTVAKSDVTEVTIEKPDTITRAKK